MTLTVTGLTAVRSGQTTLHPTSLLFHRGERVGLVGASGSGKSTLGHAIVDALLAEGQLVALVPQSPDEALDPLKSMTFHWREAERALRLAPNPIRQRTLFSALKIEGGDMRKRPWAWSRGMQQRFVIAMALIGTPSLLVLDEPTSALDPIVAASTMELLETYLAKRDTIMLLITHDLGLAADRVSRLLVMDNGRIVEDRPAGQLLDDPQTSAARSLSAHRHWLSLPC